MRTIEVDLDVYSKIWAERMVGEQSENDVLRRVLGIATTQRTQCRSKGQTHRNEEVEYSGYQEALLDIGVLSSQPVGKVRWVDDILAALRTLGGRASLASIYKQVRLQRMAGGRTIPRTFEAVIRRVIEDHSRDSANFKGVHLFVRLGEGEWGISQAE